MSGEILFFPEKSERPDNDRHEVEAGQKVSLCLKFNPKGYPYLEKVKKQAISYRLVLEDNKVPPNSIIVAIKNGNDLLEPEESDCILGEFKVPNQVNKGIYQVADLLIQKNTRNFLSVRQYLYDFTQADELKIENPDEDTIGPKLLEISTYQPADNRMVRRGKLLKIKVKQSFLFKDEGSGIAPSSLRIFYRLIEEGHPISVQEAACHRDLRNKRLFYCELKLFMPRHQWEMRNLALELDSLYITDKANNRLEIKDQRTFAAKAQGTPTKFSFSGIGKGWLRRKIPKVPATPSPGPQPVDPVVPEEEGIEGVPPIPKNTKAG